MWASAKVDFGLTEREFWRLSPKQFDALRDRRSETIEAEVERENYRAALLCSVIASHGARASRAYSPKEFLLEKPRPAATPDELLAKVIEINAHFGGLDLRSQRENARGSDDAG